MQWFEMNVSKSSITDTGIYTYMYSLFNTL